MRRVVTLLVLLGLASVLWVFLVESKPQVERGSTLLIELSGGYVEAAGAPLLARLLGDGSRSFASLLAELDKAARDDRIEAVMFRVRDLDIGWAKAEELRAAIQALSQSGRRTAAFLELSGFSGNVEIFVASAADALYASPANSGLLLGLGAEYYFLGGFWETFGVDLEVEGIGRYKSAGEMLARPEMSEPHREMANSLLDSLNERFVAGLAQSRNLSPQQIEAVLAAPPATPGALRERGIVDAVLAWDEAVERMGDGPRIEGSEYAEVDPRSVGFDPVARFALIYGSGAVVVGDAAMTPSGGPELASDRVSAALEDASEDPSIDAIIFRIDSPGGSPLASEIVWRASQRAKRAGKPLVASFSDTAASGGYYVACGADVVVASATSLVGSIGVFAVRPVVAEAFDKLDIGVAALTRGANADALMLAQPLTPSSRALLRLAITETYALFTERVAAGRGMSVAAVDHVAQGRVWTGAQAVTRGLVDVLGGLREATDVARQRVGLPSDADVELVPFPRSEGLQAQFSALLRGVSARLAPGVSLPSELRALGNWLSASAAATGSPQLLPPFLVEIR